MQQFKDSLLQWSRMWMSWKKICNNTKNRCSRCLPDINNTKNRHVCIYNDNYDNNNTDNNNNNNNNNNNYATDINNSDNTNNNEEEKNKIIMVVITIIIFLNFHTT